MHEINDAIVRDGKIVLSHLPFAEGQHVKVVVSEIDQELHPRRSIQEVRAMLKGSVEKFDDPLEPMIPVDRWEMLK
jgi:hypothetical protein